MRVVGIGATCYALHRAYKSMRAGTSHETNRMFRMRIYAQAFTIVCLCGYSFYYAEEKAAEKKIARENAERRAREKRDAWIRELEARDREEREEQTRRDRINARRKERELLKADLMKTNGEAAPADKVNGENSSVANCSLEPHDRRRLGVLEAVWDLIGR